MASLGLGFRVQRLGLEVQVSVDSVWVGVEVTGPEEDVSLWAPWTACTVPLMKPWPFRENPVWTAEFQAN